MPQQQSSHGGIDVSAVSCVRYKRYKKRAYGAHCKMLTLGPLSLWFSYTTLVAFYTPASGIVIRENDWGPTTGKHLNWIDEGDKRARVDLIEFDRLFKELSAAA